MPVLIRCFPLCLLSLFAPSFLHAQCDLNVNAGDDIYLCAPPSPTQLNGSIDGDYLNFTWTPTNGMTGSNTLTPTVTVTQTTSYVLTATAPDFNNNQVVNGDFEGGNFGFSSDYDYSPGDLVPEGLYDVIDNPQSDHPGFAACGDHTSGAGNMMVVNGSGVANENVWCETVNVMPNSQYVLSAWLCSVVASSPARLQFSINGSNVGPIFNASSQLCNWQNFFQTWNSGSNSSATICIVNQNTALSGNDFALDDIVFAPVCTVRDTVKVSVINVTAVAAPLTVIIPCDGSNVTLSGVGSSTGANISYLWDTPDGNIVSGATTLNPVVNAPGAYTLTVSYIAPDGTVCEKTAMVNVILNPNPLIAWINPAAPLGCGSATSTLIGNTNQSAFAQYSWTTQNGNIVSGADQRICTVNMEGIYELLVTNTSTGCTATAEVSVTSTTTPPVANATVMDTVTCFQHTVQLFSTGSSSGPNFSYAWTTTNGHIVSGQNTASATVDTSGIYVLHVTNTSNNCTSLDTVHVIGNLTPPYMFLPPQQQITCIADTITMIVYLYPPPYVNIVWTASNGGHIVNGQFTPNPEVDAQGMYHVVITDPDNGCTSSGGVFVTNNIIHPTANIVTPGQLTCQMPDISLSGAGSSSGGNFHYSWTASSGGNIVSGDNTLMPVVNAGGNYTLTVLDTANGCTSSASTTVTADTNVVTVIANSPDTLTCALDTITLNANGSSSGPNITYAWTTTNGHIIGGANTANPQVDQPGTYQLLLTNSANGCSGNDLAVAIQNISPPHVTIDPPGELTCAHPTQTILAHNGSPGNHFSYIWTALNGGNISSGQNTLTPVVDAPGMFILHSTNLINGCSSADTVTVTVEQGTPVANAVAPGPLTCAHATITIDGSGSSSGANYAYQWTPLNGGMIVGSDTAMNVVGGAPGDYALAVTNTSNGCISYDTVSLAQNIQAPPADAGLPDTLTCYTPTLGLIANGGGMNAGLTFAWSTSDGTLQGPVNDSLATAAAPGWYQVLVTDTGNGCTAVDSVLVLQNAAPPALDISPAGVLTCNVTNQTLLAENMSLPGNFTYHWTTSNGHISMGAANLNPVVDGPGTYLLTATNVENGCTATLSTTVMQDTASPVLISLAPAAITCAHPQELLQAQVFSQPANFLYNWTPSNGGTISMGINTLTPTVTTGGDYLLTVSNQDNGCTSTLTLHVIQDNTPPTANAGTDATLTCNLNSLTLSGSGAGGPNLGLQWAASNGGHISNGSNTSMPVIDAPGVYTLTVTNNGNGCSATDSVEIFNDASAPTVNAGTAATLTCALMQTMLNATASMGVNFTYSWTATNGGHILQNPNSLTPTVDAPGVYTLVVTNSTNGCTHSSSVTVPQNITPPMVDAGANATLTCAVTSLSLSGSSAGGAATYSWQTANGHLVSGTTGLTPVIDKTGTYTLTATLTSNGCSASDNVLVNIDTVPPAFSIQPPVLLTCSTLSTPLNGVVQQPGAGNFTSAWSTTNGHFTAPQNALATMADQPGMYLLTIHNSLNGCTATQQIAVNQNITPPAVAVAPGGQITCAVQSLHLDGSGSASGNGYTYLWTAGNNGTITAGGTTLMPTISSAGNYTLQVTNTSNGCSATASTTVSSNTTPPLAAIANPAQLTCIQNSVTLDGNGSSGGAGFSASWNSNGGHIVSGQTTFAPVVNLPGTYTLTVSNSQNGCTSTAQTQVTQNTTPPGAEAGEYSELNCNQQQITLAGSSPTPGNMNYAWSTSNGHIVSGSSSANGIVDTAGVYTLTVTNPQNGCTSTDVASIREVALPDFTPVVTQPDCHVQTGSVDFGIVSGGKSPFMFSTDGGATFSSQTVSKQLAPDTYPLVVEDAYGCTAENDVIINAPFLPTLDIPAVLTLEVGDSVLLQPVTNVSPANIASWQWTPAQGLSCTDCEKPWAKPFSSTNYLVVVTDKNDCNAQARVQVRVDRRRNIYAPNVFTPNGDGENDFFMIFGKGVEEIQTLQIFDRWGSELWLGEHLTAGDETAGWDGNYRGSPVNPAVFVWWARVKFVDGDVELFYGDVTVLR